MAMINSLVQQQDAKACHSCEHPEHLVDHQAGSRHGAIWWHYGRGERERTTCVAYGLGRAYEFRLIVSAGRNDVQRFASAVALLNHQAAIERTLIGDGWHLARFTHQLEALDGLTGHGSLGPARLIQPLQAG
jgi:hypothetical protein